MSDEIPLDSSSFNKNYQVLKQTADWLSTQKEPDRERSERIGALERGFSSPTCPLIIVVFRHSRRKGNDHAQAQIQPTATSREGPTTTA